MKPSLETPSARAVAVRIGLVALFLGAYVTIWRPVRDEMSARVMAPLLQQIDTPRAQHYEIRGAPPRTVEIHRPGQSEPVAQMATPAGLLFVIGGIVLLALRPRRLYWLYLGLYQLSLGGLMLGLLAVGLGWADWGFHVFDLVRTDIYRGTSLGLPLVFLWLEVRREKGGDD